MKFRYLGHSGLLVSRICLGTMTFGMKGWGCDASTSHEIVKSFVDGGGNFIDTADMYSAGVSEEILGDAIRTMRRDDLVLATKCWFRVGSTPNAKGLSRKHILEAVDASLKRLKTDFIDLYQLHGPDPYTPLEITLRTMDDLVRSGKIRYIGCSNFYAWQIAKANGIAERNGWSRFVSGQHLYNLLRRDVEREILPACADQGMGLMCWSPLASGLLSGKYDSSKPPDAGSRVGLRSEIDMPRYWNDQSFKIIDSVVRVSHLCAKSPSQIALAWILGDRRVSSVIIGVKTVEQTKSSLEVGDWDLPNEHRDALSNEVPFVMGYPHEWIEITKGNTSGHETNTEFADR